MKLQKQGKGEPDTAYPMLVDAQAIKTASWYFSSRITAKQIYIKFIKSW